MGKKATPGSLVEQEVREMERQLGEALTRLDIAVLDGLLADDYVFTTSAGEVITKAQAMVDLQSPNLRVELFNHDDIQVRVYGNAAVVIGRSTVKGRLRDQDLSGQYRYTRVYVRRQGRWQIVAAHLSRMAQPCEA